MKLSVKNCGDCPFCFSEYDEYSLHSDTMDKCSYSMFLRKSDYIIDVYNMSDRNEDFSESDELMCDLEYEHPEWCPLKDDDLFLKLDRQN